LSGSSGSKRLKIKPARTAVNVQKRDGSLQPFSQNKLVTSITKAGATKPQATLVANRVVASINTPAVTTTQLSGMVTQTLRKVNTTAASQYTAYSAQKYQTAAPTATPTSTPSPIIKRISPLTPTRTSAPVSAPSQSPVQTPKLQPTPAMQPAPTTVPTTTNTQTSAINASKKPNLVIEDAYVSDLDFPNPEGLCKYQKLFLHFKIRNAGIADAVITCERNNGRSDYPVVSIAYTTFASANVSAKSWLYHECSKSTSPSHGPYEPSIVLKPFQSLEYKFDLSEERSTYAPGMKPLVPGGMKPGQYAIKIIADPDNAMDELREGNNEYVVSFTVNPDYPPPINYTIYLQSLVCLETEDDTEDEVRLNVIPDGNKGNRTRIKFQMKRPWDARYEQNKQLTPDEIAAKIIGGNMKKLDVSKTFKDYVIVKLYDHDEGGHFLLEKINPDDKLGKLTIDARSAQNRNPLYNKTFGQPQVYLFTGPKNYSPKDFANDLVSAVFKILYVAFASEAELLWAFAQKTGMASRAVGKFERDTYVETMTAIEKNVREDIGDYFIYVLFYTIVENPARDRPEPLGSVGSPKLDTSMVYQASPVSLNIAKRSGSVEQFSSAKLASSIVKAGATPAQATLVTNRVTSRIASQTSVTSAQLSAMTARSLSKVNTVASQNYAAYRKQKYTLRRIT
jgi:transcriptional regulator NrdR family protein